MRQTHLAVLAAVALLACRSESRLPRGGGGGGPDDADPPVPTAPDEPGALPQVVINEVMPANQSTIDAPGTFLKPDWVELLNLGDTPVAMSEIALSSGGDRWIGPADAVLHPGVPQLVWVTDEIEDPLATGFGISKDGDEIRLVDLYGREIDAVSFDATGSDVSIARFPDGTGDLQPTAWPTPGEGNGDGPSPTLIPADATVFVPYVMHRIEFDLTGQAYQRLSLTGRPEVHAQVTIDGVSYEDVGLKLKGSASYQPMSGKPAFILDFNQWIQGTKFRDLKALKLHNGLVLDPTRNRDHLSYTLAREAGLMAPRVGWAEVLVNGEPFGLYIVIEKHDDVFIEYHRPGQQDLGVVLEPNEASGSGWSWADFGHGDVLSWNHEEGPVPPDPATIDALVRADQLVAGAPTDANVEALWEVMDREPFLTYLAWETVVMHTDGYRAPNNWRVFVDGVTHKIQLLPSGAEWTWDADVTAWSYGGGAGNWCLQNPGCRRDYAARLVEVADLADQLDLLGQFEDMQVWLDPYIQSDPRYQAIWGSGVGGARQSTREHLAANPEEARQQALQAYPELQP